MGDKSPPNFSSFPPSPRKLKKIQTSINAAEWYGKNADLASNGLERILDYMVMIWENTGQTANGLEKKTRLMQMVCKEYKTINSLPYVDGNSVCRKLQSFCM
jgi:hypothetical protein